MEDIELLANYFISKYNSILTCNIKGISPQALAIMQHYCWPGNIRELENMIERTMHFAREGIVQVNHLPSTLTEKAAEASPEQAHAQTSVTLSKQVNYAEKKAIQEALRTCDGNKSKTAALLGISRAWLYRKLRQYEIMNQ